MQRKTFAASVALTLGMSLLAIAEPRPAPISLSAAQIADKSVAARGGLSAWRAVQALSMTGKLDAGGNERATLAVPGQKAGSVMPPPRPKEQVQLPFVMDMKRPHKMRFELQFQGQTAVQVFDGTNGWKLRPFLGRKDVEPFTPEELKSASMESELDGPLVDYAAKGTKIELEGTEKVEGRDAYKLKLSNGNNVRHIWIDAETFLDIKMDGTPRRMDGKMHPVEIYMRNYQAVKGLMVPRVLETEVQGYKPTHKMMIETVVVNPKVEDSLFAKPNPAGR